MEKIIEQKNKIQVEGQGHQLFIDEIDSLALVTIQSALMLCGINKTNPNKAYYPYMEKYYDYCNDDDFYYSDCENALDFMKRKRLLPKLNGTYHVYQLTRLANIQNQLEYLEKSYSFEFQTK
jgi:hypothetical protein